MTKTAHCFDTPPLRFAQKGKLLAWLKTVQVLFGVEGGGGGGRGGDGEGGGGRGGGRRGEGGEVREG